MEKILGIIKYDYINQTKRRFAVADFKKQGSQGCNCKDMTAHNHGMKQETHGKDHSKGKAMGSERQDRYESRDCKDVK